MPVAWVKKQGAVTLTHTCAPLSFKKKTGKSHCTASVANFSKSPANTNVEITGDDNLDYSNPSAGASLIHHGEGVQWSGTLSPAIPPQITAINSTSGPAGGYLPLSLFGSSAVGGAPMTRSRTSTCPRSSTAASLIRGSASSRTGTS